MNDSWQFTVTPVAIEDAIAQLNELRNDPVFIGENDHIELGLGEARRDIMRRSMPDVQQIE